MCACVRVHLYVCGCEALPVKGNVSYHFAISIEVIGGKCAKVSKKNKNKRSSPSHVLWFLVSLSLTFRHRASSI